MTSEDRQALTQRRRERYNNTPNTRSTEEQQQQHSTTHKIPSFNDPVIVVVIVNKITEFYNDLTTLEMKKCSICSEQLPNLKIDSTGSCLRCSMDKHIRTVLLLSLGFASKYFLSAHLRFIGETSPAKIPCTVANLLSWILDGSISAILSNDDKTCYHVQSTKLSVQQ